MSLFDKLKSLGGRKEDYFTEIVAEVLRSNGSLAKLWLTEIGIDQIHERDSLIIETQTRFSALEGHVTGSCVDLIIRIRKGEKSDLVFIESKLDSTAKSDQLPRYADHLKARPDANRTYLIFITRDFEKISSPPQSGGSFKFIQVRWSGFHQSLSKLPKRDSLEEQVKLFMEENRMSMRTQFSQLELQALEHFHGARQIMDSTFDGIDVALADAVKTKCPISKAAYWLGKSNQYVIGAYLKPDDEFECFLGYHLPTSLGERVWVGAEFCARRESAFGRALEKSALVQNGWQCELWPELVSLKFGQELQILLGEPDQVDAVKNLFKRAIEDIKKYISSHPDLPWDSPGYKDKNVR